MKLWMPAGKAVPCPGTMYGVDAVPGKESNEVNPVITKAIAYIDENITAPLQVETLCRVLYITKSHLHHLFAKHMNISPKKYIMLRKLHLVQRELAAGGNPTEAAARYGFTNYSTFYRNYRKIFGAMPSDEESAKQLRQIL